MARALETSASYLLNALQTTSREGHAGSAAQSPPTRMGLIDCTCNSGISALISAFDSHCDGVSPALQQP